MAIVDYYVRADAAGGGDGTTDSASGATGAFTWAELRTRMAAGAAAAGDRYNIKGGAGGTYSLAAADTWTNDGNAQSPIIFRGFNVTKGDLDAQGRVNGNGDLDLTNYPVIAYGTDKLLNAGGSGFCIFHNLKITSASGFASGTLVLGPNNIACKCYAENPLNNSGAYAFYTGQVNCLIMNCDAKTTGATSAAGIGFANLPGIAIGCRIQSTGDGIRATQGTMTFIGNVISNCGGNGINFTQTNTGVFHGVVYGNTINSCTLSGIAIANAAYASRSITTVNNHITNCNNAIQNGYSGTNILCASFANNRLRDNSSDYVGFTDWATGTSFGDVTTDTGGDITDFVDASSKDFRLQPTAPGKAAGLIKYTDIGALQRKERVVISSS